MKQKKETKELSELTKVEKIEVNGGYVAPEPGTCSCCPSKPSPLDELKKLTHIH
jgi:hypothetical protein